MKKWKAIMVILCLMMTLYGCQKEEQVNKIKEISESKDAVSSIEVGKETGKTDVNIAKKEETKKEETRKEEGQKEKAYLQMEQKEYPLHTSKIGYKIVNGTSKTLPVVLIPKLEKRQGEKWEEVKFAKGVGFCGTPDFIEKEYKGEVMTDWYSTLGEGTYRLTFPVQDGKNHTITKISDIFVIS